MKIILVVAGAMAVSAAIGAAVKSFGKSPLFVAFVRVSSYFLCTCSPTSSQDYQQRVGTGYERARPRAEDGSYLWYVILSTSLSALGAETLFASLQVLHQKATRALPSSNTSNAALARIGASA